MSETFGRADQPWILPEIPGYSCWRKERDAGSKGGGGLCIFYREGLNPHQWSPHVPENLKYIENERQWLLIDSGDKKCALLHCYLACQTTRHDEFTQWNEDLLTLMTQEVVKLKENGFLILCMGDFNSRVGRIPGLEGNTPDVNQNGPMFLNFVSSTNLVILNTLPIAKGLFTRFMDSTGSKSVLDYGLVDCDNVQTVSSFIIDEDARYGCGSDHALLLAKLIFSERPFVQWSVDEVLRFNIDDHTDYTSYQNHLDQIGSGVPLHVFDGLDAGSKLSHITSSLLESGKRSFGLKTKVKKSPRKLPRSLITKIQDKNQLSKRVQEAVTLGHDSVPVLRARLIKMKIEIKDIFTSMKLRRRYKLRSKLLLGDPSRKKFWRFLKHHVKSAGSITGAYDNSGKMVFQQDQVESAILDHFSRIFAAQREPVFTDIEHPDMVSLSIQEIDNILDSYPSDCAENKFEEEVCAPYTLTELSQILGDLPSSKAAGIDQIPNELLKNCSFKFKQYLLSFLNQMLEEGRVPEALNTGKCMLIHKVKKTQNSLHWHS